MIEEPLSDDEVLQIKELIHMLKKSMDQLGLDDQRRSDLLAEMWTIEAQMSSSKPKLETIAKSLSSLRTLL